MKNSDMEPGPAPAPVAGGYKFLGFLVGKQRNCVSCRTYLHCILSGCVSPFIKQLKHSSIDILFSLWEEQNIGRDNCDAGFPVKLFVVTCGRGSHAMSRDGTCDELSVIGLTSPPRDITTYQARAVDTVQNTG